MDHDQTVCLRCGVPAGGEGFCESCCSQFGSVIGTVTCAETHAAYAVFSSAGAGDGERIAGDPPATADIGSDPLPRPELAIDPQAGAGELDKLSTGRAEGKAIQPPSDVARFEEVLTPGPSNLERALADYRQADAAGDPQGSTNLGVSLEQRGDLDGAIAAYRRADERGDVNGSFNLGCLLAEKGDLPGALAALGRADDRGDAAAASNLGVLLERQGDREAALAAYRRADDRGDANGAFNLGLLLAGRGELTEARAAYRRAAGRGDRDLRERAVRAEAEAASADTEATRMREAEARDIEARQPEVPSSVPTGPPTPEAGPEPDPGRDDAEGRTGGGATDQRETDALRPEQPDRAQPVEPLWTPRTSRPYWVAALCVLALLGLAAVALRRRRRRSR